jgi:hypothetical protein
MNLTTEDAISIAKGAGIAAAGAVLTYFSQWATGTDFGTFGPVVAAVLAVATNFFRKWATATKNAATPAT